MFSSSFIWRRPNRALKLAIHFAGLSHQVYTKLASSSAYFYFEIQLVLFILLSRVHQKSKQQSEWQKWLPNWTKVGEEVWIFIRQKDTQLASFITLGDKQIRQCLIKPDVVYVFVCAIAMTMQNQNEKQTKYSSYGYRIFHCLSLV